MAFYLNANWSGVGVDVCRLAMKTAQGFTDPDAGIVDLEGFMDTIDMICMGGEPWCWQFRDYIMDPDYKWPSPLV